MLALSAYRPPRRANRSSRPCFAPPPAPPFTQGALVPPVHAPPHPPPRPPRRAHSLELVRGWHAAALASSVAQQHQGQGQGHGLGPPPGHHGLASLVGGLSPASSDAALLGGSMAPFASAAAPRPAPSSSASFAAGAGGGAAGPGAPAGPPPPHEAAMEEDRCFVQWAESGAGRAAVAAELRALRARSASRLVGGVLSTPEGKEGMLRALGAAVGHDPVLAAQLRMLLGAAAAGGGGGGVGGGGDEREGR